MNQDTLEPLVKYVTTTLQNLEKVQQERMDYLLRSDPTLIAVAASKQTLIGLLQQFSVKIPQQN